MGNVLEPQTNQIQLLLLEGAKALGQMGLKDPALEARMLLSGLLGCSPTELFLRRDEILFPEVESAFKGMISRRARFEPVAYILGEQDFLGHAFFVDSRVLVPRPETETLVQVASGLLKDRNQGGFRILDVGTGSGCIAITLALTFPEAGVVGADISAEALGVALKNVERHKVHKRVPLYRSDLFNDLPKEFEGHFDMIISNPPYIKASELSQLDPDLKYEPLQALDGGPDGMSIFRKLIARAPRYLRPEGLLILEIGCSLAEPVTHELKANGFTSVRVLKDDAGLDRIVIGGLGGSI